MEKVVNAAKTAGLVVVGGLAADYIGRAIGNDLLGTGIVVAGGLFAVKGTMGTSLAAGALVPVFMNLARKFAP